MQLLEGALELGQLIDHIVLSHLGAKRPVAGCVSDFSKNDGHPPFHNGQRQFLVKFLGGKHFFFDPSRFVISLNLRVQGPVLYQLLIPKICVF